MNGWRSKTSSQIKVASNCTCSILISQCCLTSLLSFGSSSLQASRLQEQSAVLLALVIYEYDSLLLTAANNTIQWQYVAMAKQEYPNVLYTMKALICSYCHLDLLILTEKSKTVKSNYAFFQKNDRYFKRQECHKSNWNSSSRWERERYVVFTEIAVSQK